jgi:Domain of unknown function (DUF4280)
MAEQVCAGAMMKCSFGVAPSSLVVLPLHRTMTGAPAANIGDSKPMMNVVPFGMCQSLANPMVAAATAAAMGVLTPMPCIPNTPAPWVVGAPTVLLDGMPTLNKSSTLMCAWGGVIQVSFAGQATMQVP